MEDVLSYFIPLATIFSVGLFVFTFRSGIADIFYLSIKHRRHTVFILTCITIGLLLGAYEAHLNGLMTNYHFQINLTNSYPKNDDKLAATINECRKFIEAKLEGLPVYDEPTPSIGSVIKIGTRSYWDTCANVFGANHWKHDIFIKGQEGGTMLCKAYRQNSSYRSGHVESWCTAVLSPERKA